MDLSDVATTLGLLRARIEAGVRRPAVLTVTSARAGDGKSLVSYGLAANLAEANYKVLFVGADQNRPAQFAASAPTISDHPAFDVLRYATTTADGKPDVLGLHGPGVVATGSIDAIRATFARCRERYEYVVIDTSVAGKSGLALLLAAAADGVIVSVRQGRSILEADKDMSNLLRTAGANLLGVVTADERAIANFRQTLKDARPVPVVAAAEAAAHDEVQRHTVGLQLADRVTLKSSGARLH